MSIQVVSVTLALWARVPSKTLYVSFSLAQRLKETFNLPHLNQFEVCVKPI